uniref:Uncharacterized protein n=1 Tax=Arundo donax TaxID=35708 RepID=A0A0A9B0Z0_ARUDO
MTSLERTHNFACHCIVQIGRHVWMVKTFSVLLSASGCLTNLLGLCYSNVSISDEQSTMYVYIKLLGFSTGICHSCTENFAPVTVTCT